MTSQDCACFSLCHPEEVRAFFIRLPIVSSTASPWYAYLLSVYHTAAIPLPVDLRTFGAFYFPLDAQSYRIPWGGPRCNRTNGRSTAPRCERAHCEQWLNLSKEREAQARLWEREPIVHPLGAKVIDWPRRGAVRRDKHVLWRAGDLPLKAWSFAPVPAQPFSQEASLEEVILMGDIVGTGRSRRRSMQPCAGGLQLAPHTGLVAYVAVRCAGGLQPAPPAS